MAEQINRIEISVDDIGLFTGFVKTAEPSIKLMKPRSGDVIASVIIALGGGAGIALIIRAIGKAAADYLDAKGAIPAAKRATLIVKYGNKHLVYTGDDVTALEGDLTKALLPKEA